jgi:hypothetical protein
MPLRKDIRHHYRGAQWQATRARILTRARGRCERCSKPDRTEVLVSPDGRWGRQGAGGPIWFDHRGRPASEPYRDDIRPVFVVLTIAHLDHDPTHQDPERLAALCQACHLRHDAPLHRRNAAATRRRKLNNLELLLGV